ALRDRVGLKDITDALGHRTGDDLLIALAARIRDMLPAHAFCGRFDGDEFALVMTSPDADTAASAVASLTASLSRPFWINGQAVQVGVTAGLCHAPGDGHAGAPLWGPADPPPPAA